MNCRRISFNCRKMHNNTASPISSSKLIILEHLLLLLLLCIASVYGWLFDILFLYRLKIINSFHRFVVSLAFWRQIVIKMDAVYSAFNSQLVNENKQFEREMKSWAELLALTYATAHTTTKTPYSNPWRLLLLPPWPLPPPPPLMLLLLLRKRASERSFTDWGRKL